MQSFIQAIHSSIDVAALAVLAIFLPLFALFTTRAKSGHRLPLRSIPAYEKIRQLVSQATEIGQPIHIGMGSGQIGGKATPESLMGLTVFDYLSRHAALCDHPIQATTGDATVLATAQGILQRARQAAGFPEGYTGKEIVFYGLDPFAYAAGTLDTLNQEEHLASILIGRFDAEGLWIAESTSNQKMTQLGGTTEPAAAMLMQTSLDESVIGEEIFAAGAYLHRPSHMGSLAAQDLMRIIIILSTIVGVLMSSLGYWG